MSTPKDFGKTLLLLMLFAVKGMAASAQDVGAGLFDRNQDIGAVGQPGTLSFDPQSGKYELSGEGANIWGGRDAFHFAWTTLQGDFILRARMAFPEAGADPHRKIGWMVRESLRDDAAHLNAALHGDGLTALQFRKTTGSDTEEIRAEFQSPDIIQLERRGNTFILSGARFGEAFKKIETNLDLDAELFAGIYICSHREGIVERANFSNVRIIKPIPHDHTPYEQYLGSRLEIMDVESGVRTVLMESAHSIQAPNWTPDGETLIYNSNGHLYSYDLKTGGIEMLNTGFANRNNNDHVLSADGQQIAISHHNDADGGASSIYYLPVGGSDSLVKVTRDGVGASYLHGWSADKKTMLFTGSRNGQYDIYAVDVDTGEETQLTNEPGLDDGPEYSPDGQWIYFNSNRTGTMQLWRMRTDGSGQTQLTFDAYHDWFPHLSPDGERLVLISYPPEVPSGDHPFYKHCMLRTMPANGGPLKTVAYVYGGQGTINVPSWSPDGRYIAFVTNSD